MKNVIGKFLFTSFLILLLCSHNNLPAQNEIPDSIMTERIQFIQNSLKRDDIKTRIWWDGWLAGYSVATVGQGAVCFITDSKSLKQDMVLGAATTLLGVANQFISTIKPSKDYRRLELILADNSVKSDEKLRIAEQLLKAHAIQEKKARGWQPHVLNESVNLTGGLITWLGFKRTVWEGLANFALNSVITEAQIWSQPLRAKRDYETYCRKYLNSNIPVSYKPEINWYVSTFPDGAGVKIVF